MVWVSSTCMALPDSTVVRASATPMEVPDTRALDVGPKPLRFIAAIRMLYLMPVYRLKHLPATQSMHTSVIWAA